MNEYVGNSEPDKQYNAELVFFLFFIYVSFIHFFHLKESTTVTTNKEQNEYNKNVLKCGGQFAPNSVWLGPSNKTKYFFFFFHRRTRVSPLRLYGCTNFNQIGFPPNLAADEQPQKCFFGIVLIRTFIEVTHIILDKNFD